MDVMNKTIIRLFLFYGRTNEEKDQAYSSVSCCFRFHLARSVPSDISRWLKGKRPRSWPMPENISGCMIMPGRNLCSRGLSEKTLPMNRLTECWRRFSRVNSISGAPPIVINMPPRWRRWTRSCAPDMLPY